MKKQRKKQKHMETDNALTAAEEALLHDLSGKSHGDTPAPPALILPGIPAAGNAPAEAISDDIPDPEDALLRALLRSAYPSPPENLQKTVMAKVSAMAKRRRMRRAAVKWGSAAACFALLCSLVVAANPILRNNATGATDMAVQQEAFAATLYTVEDADTPAEPEYKTEMETECAQESEAEESAIPETEAETVEEIVDQPENEIPVGASGGSRQNANTSNTSNGSSDSSHSANKSNSSSSSSNSTNKSNSSSNSSNSTNKSNSSSNSSNSTNKSDSSSNSSNSTNKSDSSSNSSGTTNKSNNSSNSATETETSAKRPLPDLGAPVLQDEPPETNAVTPPKRHLWDGLPFVDGSEAVGSTTNPGGSDTSGSASANSPSSNSPASGSSSSNSSSSNSSSSNSSSSNSSSDSSNTDTANNYGANPNGNTAPSEQNVENLAPTTDETPSLTAEETDTVDVSVFSEDGDILEDAEVSLMQSKAAPDPVVVAENQVKWALITYIAPEKYAKWMLENGYTTAADFTLPDLVAGMQIPRETFHAVVVMLGVERQIDEGRFYKECAVIGSNCGLSNNVMGNMMYNAK